MDKEMQNILKKLAELIYDQHLKNIASKRINNMKPAYAVGNQTVKKSGFSIAKQASLFNKYENENK
jgi:hypothetical protein